MLIEIHSIQNHSPANLNRDDLGAPKTCFFGGALRSRISSQCLKRSIRRSPLFERLCGGVRTRRLAKLIADSARDESLEQRAAAILDQIGLTQKEGNQGKALVFTTKAAVEEMVELLRGTRPENDHELQTKFAEIIANSTCAPDMALCGRMLEPSGRKFDWPETSVEAALQVAHAISTHEARPEVDYYVAADDIPGKDAGAGYVDEALFASACFYKYFSIHWETLLGNLSAFSGNKEHLAAHTVGAFVKAAALVNPTGKQNSFAAHNLPSGMLIEIRRTNPYPVSYANAFAKPVGMDSLDHDLIGESIARLAKYVADMDVGYGRPDARIWFSPNLRFRLAATMHGAEYRPAESELASLDDAVKQVVQEIGYDWNQVSQVVLH